MEHRRRRRELAQPGGYAGRSGRSAAARRRRTGAGIARHRTDELPPQRGRARRRTRLDQLVVVRARAAPRSGRGPVRGDRPSRASSHARARQPSHAGSALMPPASPRPALRWRRLRAVSTSSPATRSRPLEVGDRPGDPQHPVAPAGAERPDRIGSGSAPRRVVEAYMPADVAGIHLAVAACAVPPAGRADARAPPHARPASPIDRRPAPQLVLGRSLDVDQQVHPVEQRAAEPAAVAAQIGLAAAAPVPHAGEPARARVGGRNQHEPRRKHERRLAANDRHAAVLERLTQGLERRTLELGELVQKQDAVVGERGLAGPGRRAPADEACRLRSCGGAPGTAALRSVRRRASRRRCGSA